MSWPTMSFLTISTAQTLRPLRILLATFIFFVSLSTTTNRLNLATLDGGSDLIFSSGLEEEVTSSLSGLVLQPASLIVESEQSAVSIEEIELTDLTETGLDLQEGKAETQVMLVANAFSVENSADGLQPLPFADAPLSLDKPAQESKLLVEPVQATSAETPVKEETAIEEVSEPNVSEPALIKDEPLKLEFGKAEVANLTSPKTPDIKPALIPENEEIKIELVWTAPVDLDLHVFEPGFKGKHSADAKSPFHRYHKVDTNGFFSTTAPKDQADNKRYTEVYRRSAKDLQKGALKLALSYRNRSSDLPDTCGTGRFAAIPALAKIKAPGFKRSELVLINPVSCDSVDENATLLIDITDITLD